MKREYGKDGNKRKVSGVRCQVSEKRGPGFIPET
jgi:hypothetical protein